MKRIGILRVVTSDDYDFLGMHQRLIMAEHPELVCETRCLPDQPNGIHDAATLAHALPQITDLAQAWQTSIDGLIISCAADPAKETLDARLSIPVIGAGHACCEAALAENGPIGVLGIEPEAPPAFAALLGDRMLGYRRPEGIACTHDIATDSGRAAIIDAARTFEANGARVLALACTGMATTDVAALVAPHTSLSVINPVKAAGDAMANRLATAG